MLTRLLYALRHLGVGILAGIPVGIVVGGLGGRLAMRVSGYLSAPEFVGTMTEAGEVVGEITFRGTLFLVVFLGASTGIVGGSLYAGVRPALAWAGRWRGVLFGGVLLALGGSLIIDPGNFDFRRFGPAALNVAMFAALFILLGTAIEPIYARIDGASRSERPSVLQSAVALLVWLAGIGALLLLGFTVLANAMQIVLGRHPPELIGASVLVAFGVALLAVTVATGWRSLKRASYGFLVVVVVFGAVRTLAGVARIIGGY